MARRLFAAAGLSDQGSGAVWVVRDGAVLIAVCPAAHDRAHRDRYAATTELDWLPVGTLSSRTPTATTGDVLSLVV